MINNCKANLQELKNLVQSLSHEQYTFKLDLLTGSSIGQHVRHILEFYISLMHGGHKGIVNYDARERDLELETNLDFVLYSIDKICSNINFLINKNELVLDGDFSSEGSESLRIKTSGNRELAYCLEHSIHHQALIKIGLIELKLERLLDNNFGVAPATIRHKRKLEIESK